MRIGIDIRPLLDPIQSGVPEFTRRIVGELFRQDKKNQYVLFANSWRDLRDTLNIPERENIELVYTRYPNKVFNFGLELALKWPKLDRLTQTDVFFVPNWNFITLSRNCRSILTVHDATIFRASEFYSIKGRLWHKSMRIKSLLKSVDRIVAVSNSTKHDLVDIFNISESKIQVIYHGISEEYFNKVNDSDLEAVKRKYKLAGKFVLFLGTLEPRKNVSGLIQGFSMMKEMFSELKGHKLVIAGARGWKYKPIFQEWEKSAFKKDIQFLGFVDHKDKPALYQLAQVFIFPSFYEGFGFPPLEAMASGTPTIVSNGTSLSEITGRGAVHVNPHMANEIAIALGTLLIDENLRQKLANHGSKRARAFTWQRAGEKYLRLINN
jgi:glycosyltransferase involved in cell wall biosynthesis